MHPAEPEDGREGTHALIVPRIPEVVEFFVGGELRPGLAERSLHIISKLLHSTVRLVNTASVEQFRVSPVEMPH